HRLPTPDTQGTSGTMLREGSTGTTDTRHGTVLREGSIRAPCMLRTRRRRASTTTRAFRTFSLDRGAESQPRRRVVRAARLFTACGRYRWPAALSSGADRDTRIRWTSAIQIELW